MADDPATPTSTKAPIGPGDGRGDGHDGSHHGDREDRGQDRGQDRSKEGPRRDRHEVSSDDGSDPEQTATTGSVRLKAGGATALAAGAILDSRYQVEAVIGEGGSGTVFRAWDRVLGEPVAVKILHPARANEKSWIKRLAREVKVARAIRHPNVCRVFELGHADGHWFVTMELAEGGTLRQQFGDRSAAAERPPGDRPAAVLRPFSERLDDVRAVCAGLAAIHAVGIIHRDVTPQNVLRMTDGRLVISDFGLAIENDDNTTVHGGTPAYMPPEASMGERSDQRSDVWQLGALLHEILFGRRAEWDRSARGVTMKWPLPDSASPVEEELARLCADCLAQDPALRPASAMVVAGRLVAAELARPRSWPARVWPRYRKLGRRLRALRIPLALAMLAVIAVRGAQLLLRPALCRSAPDKIAGIWDPRTKALVRRAFAGTHRPYAGEAFWSVNRTVERYLDAWSGMYVEACQATHVRGEQSSEVLDLRMSCLDERLSGLRALSQIFTRADGEVVGKAVSAAGALGSLDRCSDVKLLRSMVQPSEDPQVRGQVDGLRRRLAEVKATRDTGRIKDALGMSTDLVAAARRLDDRPVLAEAEATQGELQTVAGDPKEAEKTLQEAFWTAEAARDDQLKAEVSAYLIEAVGYRQGRYDEAEKWVRQTQATLQRLGGHERLQAWVQNDVGVLYHTQGKYPEALAAYHRALELAERALPAGDPDIARPLGNLAMALSESGRPAEALDPNQRAIDIFRQAFGAAHPEVATHMSNRGEILNALGRWREAREPFLAALAIWTREFPADHPFVGDTLNGIGQSFLGEAEPQNAIAPFERALAIREKSALDPARLAETRFGLARALAESGQDPARALVLATLARSTYEERPDWRAKAAVVNGWLASRLSPPVRISAARLR
jgi:tetratricopeptide (TPR) repeat protein